MAQFNFNNSNISGNVHIGDNNYYMSPEMFIKNNKSLNLTPTEEELVSLIFENTASEEERKVILDSLKNIKSESVDIDLKKKSVISFKPLFDLLKKAGNKLGVDLIKNFLKDNLFTKETLSTIERLFDSI